MSFPNSQSTLPTVADFQPILKIDYLSKSFKSKSSDQSLVVDNLSLSLNLGQILSVLGASGCGKTTLLRLIAGFEQPDTGNIFIGDRLVSSPDNIIPPEQRNVGMVFQDYALFPHLTVTENIAFGLRTNSYTARQQRIQQVLEIVRLEGLGRRYPDQLSGGQQQRVALARAIAPNPALILLDEPLSNLDVETRLRLRQELRDILKIADISTIIVTHDQEEAMAISDLVAVMQAGKLEQIDTPENIYHHPISKFVAEFVTQANFLPATKKTNTQVWDSEIGNLAIAISPKETENPNKTGLIMIRQEEILIEPELSEDSQNISNPIIRHRQFIGREFIYGIQLPSGQSILVRSSVAMDVGLRVKLSVRSPETLQVFAP